MKFFGRALSGLALAIFCARTEALTIEQAKVITLRGVSHHGLDVFRNGFSAFIDENGRGPDPVGHHPQAALESVAREAQLYLFPVINPLLTQKQQAALGNLTTHLYREGRYTAEAAYQANSRELEPLRMRAAEFFDNRSSPESDEGPVFLRSAEARAPIAQARNIVLGSERVVAYPALKRNDLFVARDGAVRRAEFPLIDVSGALRTNRKINLPPSPLQAQFRPGTVFFAVVDFASQAPNALNYIQMHWREHQLAPTRGVVVVRRGAETLPKDWLLQLTCTGMQILTLPDPFTPAVDAVRLAYSEIARI